MSTLLSAMSNLVPFSMLSSVATLDHSLAGWTLLDVPATETRVFHYPVAFERAFQGAPLVQVSLAGLDVENTDATRVRLRAVDITASGFTIQLETWLNTRVWAVDVAWLAIGA